MFVGAINQETRSVLSEFSRALVGMPVYIGCSGNFTVERILHQQGISEIHSNDISLYSCAVGSYLSGAPLEIGIADPKFEWLRPYMEPGMSSIAALLLCTEMFKSYARPEPFHRRMWAAYLHRFQAMYSNTMTRVAEALDGVKVSTFWPGDVVDFIGNVPDDAAVVCFPPTYKGGYERLYRLIDRVFAWQKPDYLMFDEVRFAELIQRLASKAAWVTLKDTPMPELAEYCTGVVQTTVRAKPVYVYSCIGKPKLSLPHQKVEPVLTARLWGEIQGPLRLARITAPQLNSLRSQYLSVSIAPATAQVNLAVMAGDELVGALAFDRSHFLGGWRDAYMMTDLAIRPTIYKRLAKLVLAAVVSHEMKAVLEQSLNLPVRTIGTTAFTENAVSMKYRGIFDLHSRKEGRINYIAPAGRWSLEEGLAWWKANHSQTWSA